MIIETVVQALRADSGLAGLFGARIYPGSLPDAPNYPACVVSRAGGVGQYVLAGDAGIERARVQISIFTEGYAQTEECRAAVRSFMVARPPFGPPCMVDAVQCMNDFDLPTPGPLPGTERAGPRLRERVLEFIVWTKPH